MNLTDEQIKQALEFCANCECNSEKTEKECALINMSFCKNYLRKQSLDYFNRLEAENSKLQSEIESLRKENDELKNDFFQKHYKESECQELLSVKEAWRKEQMHNIELQAEIERITDNFNCQQTVYADLSKIIKEQAKKLKTARTEAVKEFAERLKEECSFECDVSLGYGRPCYEDAVPIIAIDNLLKEMVGDYDHPTEKGGDSDA